MGGEGVRRRVEGGHVGVRGVEVGRLSGVQGIGGVVGGGGGGRGDGEVRD